VDKGKKRGRGEEWKKGYILSFVSAFYIRSLSLFIA
jgi:hypothetical protein